MAAPRRLAQRLGLSVGNFGSIVSMPTNAANTWAAISFVPDSGRTLSAVRVFISVFNGTLGANDITLSLYSSTGSGSACAPNAAIEAGKVPSATITATGWYNFTGFTTSLTANTQYWLVMKNVNGTPASNNASLQVTPLAQFDPLMEGGSSSSFGWTSATTSNAGSTWAASTLARGQGYRIGYADGTFDGVPFSAASALSADLVYATRESGVKFTTPANGVLNVAGAAVFVGTPTGTPTGNMRIGLWSGSTPSNLAYTPAIALAVGTLASGGWICAYFASTQVIQPGTVLRVTLGETTQSDSSSNAFAVRETAYDSDSDSLTLLPFEGTWRKTYFDGTNWTDNSPAGSVLQALLILNSDGEFAASGGGAVLSRVRAGM